MIGSSDYGPDDLIPLSEAARIDDCVCVVVRAYTSSFQALLGGVDLAMVAPELDRMGWLSAAIAAPFEDAP